MITPSDVADRITATSRGVCDEPAGAEGEADHHREADGDQPSQAGDAQHAPAEMVELDLHAREEEEEDEADRREHLDRRVDLHPSEHRRPDHDPGDDLEHDRRQSHPRKEAEHERRDERRRDDQQQT